MTNGFSDFGSPVLDVPRFDSAKRVSQSLHGSCATCQHSAKDGPDLTCRRMPPQVTVLLVPMQRPGAALMAQQQPVGVVPQAMTSFPIVRPEMWCGEFLRNDAVREIMK